MIEHGAYTKLLDWQYTNERELPEDNDAVYRLAGAMNAAERKAVDSVRQQFFRHEGWNERARVEIERDRPRMEAAAINGKKSKGRPANVPRETSEIKPSGLQKDNPVGFQLEPSDNPQGSLPTPHTLLKDIPTSSGASPPDDPIKAIWDRGLKLLGSTPSARSLLGKVRKQYGDVVVLAAITAAESEMPTDPVSWLVAACANQAKQTTKPTVSGESTEAWNEVREANRSNRWPAAWRHPKTNIALTAIGGRARLADMQVNDVPFLQREFEQAYRSAAT